MNNYIVFHLHTNDSNLFTTMDSITNYKQYIDKANQLGMKALAFSEHGNVCGWINKKKYCEEKGIKYIHAVEAYVTKNLDEKVRDNKHVILIAKNWDGVKEINKLMSHKIACNRKDNHFYYNPRITMEELKNTSDNVIITSACIGGILNSDDLEMKADFINFLKNNRYRCFLEIQHHNVKIQKDYNIMIGKLSEEIKVPLIAGTDTHSLNNEHVEGVKLLQASKKIKYDDNEEEFDLSFKSYNELIQCYKAQNSLPMNVVIEAIENTNMMANMVDEFEFDRSLKYPSMGSDSFNVLKQKIREGLKRRKPYIENIPREVINDRINMELKTIKKVGAEDFILLEEYVKRNARENGKYPGYSRGSCSGSFICYLLGITEVNSIRFDMNFFRFINPDRVSLMDVDSDWFEDDKEWVQHFLLDDDKFNSSYIITFNTIAFKGAVRDVGRGLKLNDDLVEELCSIDDIKDESEKIKTLEIYKQKYPDIFRYIDILKGTVVSFGSHPAGIIVTDRNIDEELGTVTLATSDYPVSCANMKEVDFLNFVKLDCLGLANIGVINQCCEMVGIERLTPDNVDLEDEAVWMSIANDSTSIFQFESKLGKETLKNMFSKETLNKVRNEKFSFIKWFSFANGLLRPSCASFRDRATHGEGYDNGLKEINDFLANTLGYVTYQEQIMLFLMKFCNYSGSEADTVRRGIAKKYGTEQLLPEIENRFIEYSHKVYGVSKDKLKEIIKPFLQIVLDASSYGFSENHSDPYSIIGYILGYLRYYYPVEYCASSLNVFGGKKEKLKEVTNMAKEMGIKILPIKFRKSKAKYMADKENYAIYKGIGSIAYLNNQVSDELYSLRNNKYNNFIELLRDLDKTTINSRQLEILIKLDFFSEFGGSKKLLSLVTLYNEIASKKVFNKDKIPCGISLETFKKYSKKETEKQLREVDIEKLISDVAKQIPDKDIPLFSKLKTQLEYLGYIDYKNEDLKNYGYVLEINDKYTPKIKIYRLDLGDIIEYKISRRIYKGLNQHDIVYIYGTEKKQKSKKVGEKLDKKSGKTKAMFEKIDEYEDWIVEYELINQVGLKH